LAFSIAARISPSLTMPTSKTRRATMFLRMLKAAMAGIAGAAVLAVAALVALTLAPVVPQDALPTIAIITAAVGILALVAGFLVWVNGQVIDHFRRIAAVPHKRA
jgi:hypothetical protein